MLKKDLASALGISGPMVSKLSARGMPTHSIDAARQWRAANLSQGYTKRFRAPAAGAKPARVPDAEGPAQAEPAANRPPDESHDKARTRREIAEANLAELKLAELQGSLVRADDVRHSLSRRATAFREGLLQLPDRLSAQLAAEADQDTVRRLLDVEIRATLTHLVEAL